MHELREWRNSFINVQSYMDDLVVCRGRIGNMQEEVREGGRGGREGGRGRERGREEGGRGRR